MKTEHANLIADIVGHPDGEPSLDDLYYLNPSLDTPEIRDLLEELEQDGTVTETEHGYKIRGESPRLQSWDESDNRPTVSSSHHSVGLMKV